MDSSKFLSGYGGLGIELLELRSVTDQIFITNYGARVVSWWTPDQQSTRRDIVLGFDHVGCYHQSSAAYYGATIGRYANRISDARFDLDGQEYILESNLGHHHLHGGSEGLHSHIWEVLDRSYQHVVLRTVSPDGQGGYPGQLEVTVTYQLTGSHLAITYHAETTADTIVNMTHHSYFNLDGEGSGSIYTHLLHIDADHYLPIDSQGIPTGAVDTVLGTVLDFTSTTMIGEHIDCADPLVSTVGGYDHTYLVDNHKPQIVRYIAEASSRQSGIVLECWSDKPSIQLYTTTSVEGKLIGKSGKAYRPHAAVCLEPQYFPDSPRHDHFPSTIVRRGEAYHSSTIYKCSVQPS